MLGGQRWAGQLGVGWGGSQTKSSSGRDSTDIPPRPTPAAADAAQTRQPREGAVALPVRRFRPPPSGLLMRQACPHWKPSDPLPAHLPVLLTSQDPQPELTAGCCIALSSRRGALLVPLPGLGLTTEHQLPGPAPNTRSTSGCPLPQGRSEPCLTPSLSLPASANCIPHPVA